MKSKCNIYFFKHILLFKEQLHVFMLLWSLTDMTFSPTFDSDVLQSLTEGFV